MIWPQALSTDAVRAAVAVGHDLTVPLPMLDVSARIAALQGLLRGLEDDDEVDALLVTHLTNIRYLTGFTGSAARLLVPVNGDAVLITDARYDERSHDELSSAGCAAAIEVRRTVRAQNDLLAEVLAAASIHRLGLEADHITWSALTAYDDRFEDAALVQVRGATESLRRTKDAAELARLARASAIADAALLAVLPVLADAPTEVAFARILEEAMIERGADGISFETIVAAGPNASRPHHESGGRAIVDGDHVICDFGALVEGYHSDMTRTICIGEPSMAQRRHFAVVKDAHDAGVAFLRPGVTGVEADAACRELIAAVGWGEQFTHGTGHGSGLDIHEDPFLGETSTFTLQAGDIATIEPGVYFPGLSGVRVEDSMVVTDDGAVLLTRAPYELVV